jgi:hypothetical protein
LTAVGKGATPSEWKAFVDLGLTSELLPVVSDTSLPVSPRSSLKEIGKVPSTINRLGQIVGLPEWTGKQATDREVAKWSSTPELGVCLNTRRYRAVDIDIADKAEAERVATMVEMVLGPLPRRTRPNSGKMVLLFEMEGVFPKRRLATSHGLIEFLGNGNQCVLAGTHPSGVRYEWLDGLPKEIPTVTPAEFEPLWGVIVAAFGLKGEHHVDKAPVALEKPRRSDDIDDEVVDYLEREGHVTGYAPDGKVFVRCPWKGLHSSDNGPSETTWLPRGVGGGARGHFKCMHTGHGNKTDDQFLHEIGFFNDQFEIVAKSEQAAAGLAPVEDWPAFKRDRQSRIESSVSNMLAALRRPDFCGARLASDTFRDAVMISWDGAADWRTLRDNDYTELRRRLEGRGFKSPGREMVRDGALLVAEQNAIDTAEAWARGLVWDGVERVEQCLHRYFRAADTPYTRAVSRYMWSGLAGRCVQGGIQCDMVPVLVGKQGAGKTQGVKALAPIIDTYVEVNLEHRDDNLARSLRGKLVGELGELRGLMTRDAEAIKAWISRTHEEWIPKYMEFATKFPRRLMFIGTTNSDEFLADSTGERRWLPVPTGVVDLDALRADRDQLWAEALVLFEREGVRWEAAHSLAEPAREAHKATDMWDEAIEQWLESDAMDGPDGPKRGDTPFTLNTVALGALGITVKEGDMRTAKRVGAALTRLGYFKRDYRGETKGKHWFRAEKRTKHESAENADFV